MLPSRLHWVFSLFLKIQLRYHLCSQSLALRLLNTLDLRVVKQSLCVCFLTAMTIWSTETESVPSCVPSGQIKARYRVFALNDCWLSGWFLRAGSIEALSGFDRVARVGVVGPALLEDSMPAVRVHLRLLAGLGKCNVKAPPSEAGTDHEQLLCEVH